MYIYIKYIINPGIYNSLAFFFINDLREAWTHHPWRMAWVDGEIILEVKPIRVRNFPHGKGGEVLEGAVQGGLGSPPLEVSEERLDLGQRLVLVTLEGFSNGADPKFGIHLGVTTLSSASPK